MLYEKLCLETAPPPPQERSRDQTQAPGYRGPSGRRKLNKLVGTVEMYDTCPGRKQGPQESHKTVLSVVYPCQGHSEHWLLLWRSAGCCDIVTNTISSQQLWDNPFFYYRWKNIPKVKLSACGHTRMETIWATTLARFSVHSWEFCSGNERDQWLWHGWWEEGQVTSPEAPALDLGFKYTRLVSKPSPADQVDSALLPCSMAESTALTHYGSCQKVDKG